MWYQIRVCTLTPSKISAISGAPQPENVSQLQSFLGLVNFYGRFIPNASQVLYPLNMLLQKGATWKWTDECESAFKTVKECLTSSEVLMHYDPTLPLVLECDASPFGLGACLLQPEKTGTLRPISYISRSLAKAEKNYSQIER